MFNVEIRFTELLITLCKNQNIGDGRMEKNCIIRRMRWEGYVARMVVRWNGYRLLVGKPEGKRPLGRPRRWWVMDLGDKGGVDWIDLAQDRDQQTALVNPVMNLRVP
jgi:hypothetical protein